MHQASIVDIFSREDVIERERERENVCLCVLLKINLWT